MVKIRREHLLKERKVPAEVYYSARGRALFNGVWWNTVGWGSTPQKARLNLLWQMGRRRNDVR